MKGSPNNTSWRRLIAIAVAFGSLLCVTPAWSQATPTQPPAVKNAAKAKKKTRRVRRPKSYDIKLRELEERAVGLKEKIYETKTRLMLLREQLLGDGVEEARAVIVHNNDMGSSFTLERVLYYLDDEKIYFQDNHNGVLDDRKIFEVFNGNVLPGNHLVSVELVYRGNGKVFSYIDGYQFKIRSKYNFFAAKGRITRIEVVGHERGGMTTDLVQKPYVRYDVKQLKYSRANLEKVKDGKRGDEDE
jgi:hypothetical protein